MVKPVEPRFCTVVWLDAFADGVADVTMDTVMDQHKPLVMETRGWVLVDDEVGVSLFYERCMNPLSWRGRTFIPRGMVRSVEDFPAKKPRAPKLKIAKLPATADAVVPGPKTE